MDGETIYIKNMVCDRCILIVQQEFSKLEIPIKSIVLGEVTTRDRVSNENIQKLSISLKHLGFELLENKNMRIVERVKNIIIDLIHRQQVLPQTNLSDYLSQQIGMDYNTISKTFSNTEHKTIEKFVISQKIERAKELISYNELTLNEIADLLHYSSVAHLSNQFKKVVGVTPSEYKKNSKKERFSLDNVH